MSQQQIVKEKVGRFDNRNKYPSRRNSNWIHYKHSYLIIELTVHQSQGKWRQSYQLNHIWSMKELMKPIGCP